MESKVAVSPTQENGLAVLSRLAVRPGVFGCLAPADPGEEEQGVGCPITSLDWNDTDTALEAYMTEVICKAVLPLVAGEGQVPIGGCEAGLVTGVNKSPQKFLFEYQDFPQIYSNRGSKS